MKKSAFKLIPPLLLLLVIILGFVFVYAKTNRVKPVIIQGETEAHRIDISARVQGRVKEFYFDVGDYVEQGASMLILESPPLLAQQITAESQLAVAIASMQSVYSTRPEAIQVQQAQLEEAKAKLRLAEQNYKRISVLSKSNAVSKQDYDATLAQYQVAQKSVAAAQAHLLLAVNGSSIEEKQLADAHVQQAKATLNQLNTDVQELHVVAPISGSITSRIAEQGQLYNPNTPLFSVLDTKSIWFTFNIREDFLHGIKIGDTFTVTVPALNSMEIPVRVTALNVLGSYANWQATKATGNFDLRTFELRAVPVSGSVNGLRAGMTAIYTVNE